MGQDMQLYKSHRIEILEDGDERSLVIDGKRMPYGQLPDGLYYLKDYAYDPAEDLAELAQKYVDYLEAAERVRAEQEARMK